ncbi:hypothetical protein DFP72DRAFT_824242, partial [Ephemerocybe angulata]
LPNELWSRIFYFCSTPPYPPFVSSAFSTSPPQHSHSCLLEMNRTSMWLKCQLTLVSKRWCSIATPVLFQHIWIANGRDAERLARVLETPIKHTSPRSGERFGLYIRHIHVETPTYDRCPPQPLLTLLEHASCIRTFSDIHSIRRSPNSSTGSESCTVLPRPASPPMTDEEIMTFLLDRLCQTGRIRRLCWTVYDSDACTSRRGLTEAYFRQVLEPKLRKARGALEHLELSISADCRWTGGPSFLDIALNENRRLPTLPPSKASYVLPMAMESNGLDLPRLRSLKVGTDDALLGALTPWRIPRFQNLCLVSDTFSTLGPGLSNFLHHHGGKLVQLELCHESKLAGAEYRLTPHPASHLSYGFTIPGQRTNPRPLHTLADLCPKLIELIYDAETIPTYQLSDRTAPHPLMTSHPGLRFIGIRNIENLIYEGLERLERRAGGQHMAGEETVRPQVMVAADPSRAISKYEGEAWSAVLSQFRALLDRDLFPSLVVPYRPRPGPKAAAKARLWAAKAHRNPGPSLEPPNWSGAARLTA